MRHLTGVDGYGEALHRRYSESSQQRADADVDQDVGTTGPRTEIQNQNRTQNQHRHNIDQETWQRQAEWQTQINKISKNFLFCPNEACI